jgi:hypothetical protein
MLGKSPVWVIRCVAFQPPGRPLSAVTPRATEMLQRCECSEVPKGDTSAPSPNIRQKQTSPFKR